MIIGCFVVPRPDKFDGITSYIQRVMNILYMKTPEGGHCSADMVEDAINYILNHPNSVEGDNSRSRKG